MSLLTNVLFAEIIETLMKFQKELFVFLTSLFIFLGSFLAEFFVNYGYYKDPDSHTLPQELDDYIEQGYEQVYNMPKGSPIGGDGTFIHITAGYDDAEYKKMFGIDHLAIDLIPTEKYYSQSIAFNKVQEIILISTMSGTACSKGNLKAGFTIEIVSYTNKYKVIYHHQKRNFIPLNTCSKIHRGIPIGIMGDTGYATGIHLHYMIMKQNEKQEWITQNPINYLH